MAQRATRSSVTRANRRDSLSRTFADGEVAGRAIPLNLVPLLQSYKKHGRISLRIERLPQSGLLSAGRNNGDNSWSLTFDDLENLSYLPPEGMDGRHTLAIRIISLSDGSTLAVLDFCVSPTASAAPTANANPAEEDTTGADDNTELRLLRDELEKVKAALAAREGDVKPTQETAQPETEASAAKTEPDAAATRSARKTELDEREFASLTAGLLVRKCEAVFGTEAGHAASAATGFLVSKGEARPSVLAPSPEEGPLGGSNDAELCRLREELQRIQSVLADRDAALAQANLSREQERARWQQQLQESLAKAQNDWKTDEAARLAAAEAQWRTQSASALAEATKRSERAEQSLAEVSVKADAVAARDKSHEGELRLLREELSAAQAALADRDAALKQSGLTIDQERERWRQKSEEDLSKAKAGWNADEAKRLAAADAQWQQKLAAAVAEARAQAEGARDQDHRIELDRVGQQCAALRASLADRETALANAGSAHEQERKRWRQESEDELAKAKASLRAEEAARFAAVNAEWQQRLATAIAETRSQVVSLRDQGHETELHRLRQECATLQATLASRDAALTQANLSAERERERAQRQAQEMLAKAEAAWKTDEATRFAATESQWQQKLATALADTRAQAASVRDQGHEVEINRFRQECAALQTTVADRDAALAQAKLANEQEREKLRQDSEGVLSKAKATWKAEEAERFAAAEAQWQERLTKTLADTKVQAEAPNQGSDAELRRLSQECTALRATLADRETALAEACLAIEQARRRWQHKSEDELSKAKTDLKDEGAARLAATEAQWQERLAKAVVETRAQVQAERDQGNDELNRLREQFTALQTTLSEGERATAESGLAVEQEREKWKQESETRLANARTGWITEEAARLKAAEAQWQRQSAAALAEATKRCERAELALADASAKANAVPAHDKNSAAEVRRLREQLAVAQETLAQREVELMCVRSSAEHARDLEAPKTEIVLQSNRMRDAAWGREREDEGKVKPKPRLMRDVAIAVSLGVAAILLYPRIAAYLPPTGAVHGVAPAAAVASQEAPVQPVAVVTRGANVRTGPSTDTNSLLVLQSGVKVAIIERRGNWTHVRANGNGTDAQPIEGWVFSSFLKEEPEAEDKSSAESN